MTDADAISGFLRRHRADPVGATPPRPDVPPPDDDAGQQFDFTVEREQPADWAPIVLGEDPARDGEFPRRFIDGSHLGQPVLCVRSPQGYPVALVVAEVGAVALKLVGRQFVREFRAVERVLGMVVDPFPWAEIEAFAGAMANHPLLRLRVLPARMPDPHRYSPFDYEAYRQQAVNRCQNEMLKLEVLALAVDPGVPTLVDGQLGGRIGEQDAARRPLLVGVVKAPTPAPLHDHGFRTLLDLRPAHRTPYFLDTRTTNGRPTDVPIASWYLRLAGGPRTAPNWGVVRVDVPWVQLTRTPPAERTGFVNRLSRWLVDARCRTDSYARMPVSLDPIVRAEDALKPLFTPVPVLVNRLYRTAGLFRGTEL
ncbi:MAG: hypothetical protein JWO38_5773 [Gemmataceae bacterium]|nr:hypothetical protein [Gemmataceae bacterium]